ncbi:hypothetical protein K7X08_007263 [Anisodus acutangulus]|uniref:RING-type E3 ubiquitin transferase n=1 Tax=Anisodus acutangulus TaxID=402998 RepID=A0A9Q1LF31_9SOLA|nr:hypothetical protein K7X08_007263 [Anisodus acutangulus]
MFDYINYMTSGNMLDYNNFITGQLTDQERNLPFARSLFDIVSHLLDDMDVHDEENEDDDDVLKKLLNALVSSNVPVNIKTKLNTFKPIGVMAKSHERVPSIVVNNHSRYYPVPYYELIEDVYVVTDPSESIETSGMLDNNNFITSQLTDQERNLAFERSLYDIVSHRLDGMDVRDEENDHVLKYLKLTTHSAPAKEGVNPQVVADVESETCACAICQSEYEHEEDIGTLQCGHEYHVNCIKQWLLRKKDCPMCRASVLPSQEQIL